MYRCLPSHLRSSAFFSPGNRCLCCLDIYYHHIFYFCLPGIFDKNYKVANILFTAYCGTNQYHFRRKKKVSHNILVSRVIKLRSKHSDNPQNYFTLAVKIGISFPSWTCPSSKSMHCFSLSLCFMYNLLLPTVFSLPSFSIAYLGWNKHTSICSSFLAWTFLCS